MPRKPVLLTGALALVLTLTACGAGPADETGDDGAELVTEVTEETTVTMWHTLTGHHQEALEAQQTPEFVQFMEENPVMGALAESLENVGYIPAVTGSETARSSLDRAAQQILLGESDIATALEAAETETNRAMAE
ncbi:hypothetical protein Q0N61_07735 [Corynebacterium sanguinis]|uniref:hypothetical protein n=1 Tax=Corynebacterium sanguinis TaxID=2594913 RepID=UPI0026569DED|nr:hypothetical protein [Corynebacterium sanguinis]MDN8622673.1 hypothetical protein [Corynebacterium sanguinis]